MFEKIKNNKTIIICIALVAIVACAGVYFYLHHQTISQEKPKVMEYADTTDPEKLKNTLDVDANTAGQIVKQIEYIHDGITPPTATYYVAAPTLEKAADTTDKDIKTAMATGKNTKNLPVAAAEKTDRTVVTADEKDNKVDVYKINLRNNHKLKVGALDADNTAYIGAGYQAGKVEVMAYIGEKGKRAAAVNYTIKEW